MTYILTQVTVLKDEEEECGKSETFVIKVTIKRMFHTGKRQLSTCKLWVLI